MLAGAGQAEPVPYRALPGVSPYPPAQPRPAQPVPPAPVSAPQPAPAPGAQAAAKPVIGYAQALILIRSSLVALQQADETGDYSVLYGLGSAGFRQINPPEKLSQTFAGMRRYNIGAVLVLEPQFSQAPQLDANGMLAMAGVFSVEGFHINFRLIYAPEDGHWRLFGISVRVQVPPGTQAAPLRR